MNKTRKNNFEKKDNPKLRAGLATVSIVEKDAQGNQIAQLDDIQVDTGYSAIQGFYAGKKWTGYLSELISKEKAAETDLKADVPTLAQGQKEIVIKVPHDAGMIYMQQTGNDNIKTYGDYQIEVARMCKGKEDS